MTKSALLIIEFPPFPDYLLNVAYQALTSVVQSVNLASAANFALN